MVCAMSGARCNLSLKAIFVIGVLTASTVGARAAETAAQPAGPSCAEQDRKIAEQAAEIARLNKRVEQLEEELDLSDIE